MDACMVHMLLRCFFSNLFTITHDSEINVIYAFRNNKLCTTFRRQLGGILATDWHDLLQHRSLLLITLKPLKNDLTFGVDGWNSLVFYNTFLF